MLRNALGNAGHFGLSAFGVCFGTLVCCLIPMDQAQKEGPYSALITACVIAGIVVGLSFFALRGKREEFWMGIATAAGVPLATWFIFVPIGEQKWQEQVTMADEVAEYGLKHFPLLDTDENGEVSDSELKACLDNANLGEPDRKYVSHMRGHASVLGHVNGSQWVGEVAVNTYGISRDDLVTYKARTEKSRKARV